MPYRRSNFDFVIDSSFQPFSMQEMLVPFTAYKEADEKDEAAYQDLTDRADTFKYLAKRLEDNQDSESARIYKGYADELNRQAQDLANNGLTMSGRRGLTNLKRRYQGEIGRLVTADAAMKEEQKLRRANKDNSMLYAQDNLDIDDFLDGKTPNLYSISGNELYTRGAQAGKTASSRVYNAGDEGSTLGGYYRKWVERNGYSKESMDAFRANASAIPELQQAADAILVERGAAENLTGNNLERARQSVINGIIDGAVYTEKVNPVRDAGVMSSQEQASNALSWANHNESVRQHNLQLKMAGFDENGVYHPELDQSVSKARAIAEAKNAGKGSGSKGSSSEYGAINQQGVRISWKGNTPNNTNGDADNDVGTKPLDKDEEYVGRAYDYDDLPQYAKNHVDKVIGNKGNYDNYVYYFKPFKGSFWGDTEAELDIVPRKVMKDNSEEEGEFDFGS
jgi:hypothetical protein